ncbi:MAG: class I SAM-dependent methyltransferase, partial [Candidatus Micrarchaeaceae archaeon]
MYLPERLGGRLLDVGCGSGDTIDEMQRRGWNCEGIDFDPETARIAQERGFSVYVGELHAQRYPGDTFDAIVMSHVIEHVPDPLGLFEECRRILKPGGRLIVLTPNGSSWGHQVFGANWLYLDPPRHLHIFTFSSIRKLGASISGMRWHPI